MANITDARQITSNRSRRKDDQRIDEGLAESSSATHWLMQGLFNFESIPEPKALAAPTPARPVGPSIGYQIYAKINGEFVASYTRAGSEEQLNSRMLRQFPVEEGYSDHYGEAVD